MVKAMPSTFINRGSNPGENVALVAPPFERSLQTCLMPADVVTLALEGGHGVVCIDVYYLQYEYGYEIQ